MLTAHIAPAMYRKPFRFASPTSVFVNPVLTTVNALSRTAKLGISSSQNAGYVRRMKIVLRQYPTTRTR